MIGYDYGIVIAKCLQKEMYVSQKENFDIQI